MSDETNCPDCGEGVGLPDFMDEAWRKRAAELEDKVQVAITELLAFTKAAAVSIPFRLDGRVVAVLAGDTEAVLSTLETLREVMVPEDENAGKPN